MEDYVTFDTAMSARDNEYREGTGAFYKLTEEENIVHQGYSNNLVFRDLRVSAPTQTELQKWLRKNYGIEVLVTRPYNFSGQPFWSFEIYNDGIILNIINKVEFKTYEESLEVGLRFGLNLIHNTLNYGIYIKRNESYIQLYS